MKKMFFLVLVALVSVACSKNEENKIPDDLHTSFTYVENKGNEYTEKTFLLIFSLDNVVGMNTFRKTLDKNGKIITESKHERATYSYQYPNLEIKLVDGRTFQGKISEDKKKLTLYNFSTIYFTPKTSNVVLISGTKNE